MKKPLALFLSVALTLGIAAPFAQAASFKDASENYRFYEDIDYLSDTGIINDFPDGWFMPETQVTRAFDVDGTKRSKVGLGVAFRPNQPVARGQLGESC